LVDSDFSICFVARARIRFVFFDPVLNGHDDNDSKAEIRKLVERDDEEMVMEERDVIIGFQR
ncbi:unnamed protein product, partial [Amoebophrya sp. A25]